MSEDRPGDASIRISIDIDPDIAIKRKDAEAIRSAVKEHLESHPNIRVMFIARLHGMGKRTVQLAYDENHCDAGDESQMEWEAIDAVYRRMKSSGVVLVIAENNPEKGIGVQITRAQSRANIRPKGDS